tara:strand:+ start:5891 stop:7663 length:1773 start_codon:yes stop_codon:yes gene_type:complete
MDTSWNPDHMPTKQSSLPELKEYVRVMKKDKRIKGIAVKQTREQLIDKLRAVGHIADPGMPGKRAPPGQVIYSPPKQKGPTKAQLGQQRRREKGRKRQEKIAHLSISDEIGDPLERRERLEQSRHHEGTIDMEHKATIVDYHHALLEQKPHEEKWAHEYRGRIIKSRRTQEYEEHLRAKAEEEERLLAEKEGTSDTYQKAGEKRGGPILSGEWSTTTEDDTFPLTIDDVDYEWDSGTNQIYDEEYNVIGEYTPPENLSGHYDLDWESDSHRDEHKKKANMDKYRERIHTERKLISQKAREEEERKKKERIEFPLKGVPLWSVGPSLEINRWTDLGKRTPRFLRPPEPPKPVGDPWGPEYEGEDKRILINGVLYYLSDPDNEIYNHRWDMVGEYNPDDNSIKWGDEEWKEHHEAQPSYDPALELKELPAPTKGAVVQPKLPTREELEEEVIRRNKADESVREGKKEQLVSEAQKPQRATIGYQEAARANEEIKALRRSIWKGEGRSRRQFGPVRRHHGHGDLIIQKKVEEEREWAGYSGLREIITVRAQEGIFNPQVLKTVKGQIEEFKGVPLSAPIGGYTSTISTEHWLG